ncbi:MAG: ATP-dependent DNA helicase Rep [Thermoanaerobaculia bacterium]|nr:ATP-dependent DNA helicase Rep [Thermoanaerobaculia bacterium]
MTVAFARTFMESANQLTLPERGRVFDFMTKYQQNAAHPSLSLERISNADKSLWSARITQGLRAILVKDGDQSIFLYASHHDDAYTWAERRRFENHPVTGAVQVVEVASAVREEVDWQTSPGKPSLFATRKDEYLSSLGVPLDWLPLLHEVQTEEQLLSIIDRLPEEVAERLLRLASGELVAPPAPVSPGAPLSANPDNLRRFRVIESEAELQEVLSKPLSAWLHFLHPSQRDLVTATFKGPVKVTGGAGTGKTVVALHRARHLAKPGKKVLLTSFVGTLCRNFERSLDILCSGDERKRITAATVTSVALDLLKTNDSKLIFADEQGEKAELKVCASFAEEYGDVKFLWTEWRKVISPQGITTWAEYRDAQRTGRGKPLTVAARKKIWQAFAEVIERLETKKRFPEFLAAKKATLALEAGTLVSPFDAVLVDEVQDLTPVALRLIAALGKKTPENLLVVGDAGQRIYPRGFSLRALGIDVRGRSRILKFNYRTTKQIQAAAEAVLSGDVDDLDGETETRKDVQSILSGPVPVLSGFETPREQDAFIVSEIERLKANGFQLSEIAVFARTNDLARSIQNALHKAGIESGLIDRSTDGTETGVQIGTMHRAKGLEFKAVIISNCQEGCLPSPAALKEADSPAEREILLALERQLLYVSLTRARDEAIVTWCGEPSPFLSALLQTQRTAP